MKRVFISLLVLVMASIAGADFPPPPAPRILVNGDKYADNVIVHSNPTLGIWTDAEIWPETSQFYALVVDTSFGTIDYTSGITAPPYNTDGGISLAHNHSASTFVAELPPGVDGIFGSVLRTEYSIIESGAILFDGIDYSSSWPLPVRIDLYATIGAPPWTLVDTVYITIPEPMTVGLLGLGALFLRKRKA